jgi:hypothetical protein
VVQKSRPKNWSVIESEIRRVWSERGLDTSPAFAAAAPRVLGSLESREIRSWFKRGTSPREAWCERGFDMILDRDWISGTFDRVVIDRDKDGRATGATILDFKTDEVADETAMAARAAGYAPQLKLYVRAVCRLTGLPEDNVRTALIFTSLARLHWL